MKYNIKNNILRAAKLTLGLGLTMATTYGLTSCAEQENTLVEYAENNTLQSPNDTVYSLLGIISKMQVVADRTVLLGEIRGDLTALTANASLNLKALADFTAGTDNPYNSPSDYYAIIQNCNYYIKNVNKDLTKRGEKVFEKELSVIKTYRAWAYLQLALNYGSVPFFTEPILTEKDADISNYPKYDVKQIAEYFISDLAGNEDTNYPAYGAMNGNDSKTFYIPVRVLLGDLCLWAGQYQKAASYYHDYLTKTGDTHPTQKSRVYWESYLWDNILGSFSDIHTTIIPMEESENDGVISYLDEVFCSVEDNNYYHQATYSQALLDLSKSQKYTIIRKNSAPQLPDTLSPDSDVYYENPLTKGDLRLSRTYSVRTVASSSSKYNNERQTNTKITTGYVTLYRLQQIYLRYAEALNRAGYPEAAFFVLKNGICKDNLDKYMSNEARAKAGDLISFSQYVFTTENTLGIHSRGSGESDANKSYSIPYSASLNDSILFVEDKICDELALETASEGFRFYDLMRISMHRNDPTFLAAKVAGRNGAGHFDNNLYTKLSTEQNWYLPLP